MNLNDQSTEDSVDTVYRDVTLLSWPVLPYTSGLEQWVLDFSPNLSQKEKRYILAILFGI